MPVGLAQREGRTAWWGAYSLGGGATLLRRTISGWTEMRTTSPPVFPPITSTRRLTASAPMLVLGTAMVVSGGLTSAEVKTSSNPTTEMSSGTE